MKLPTFIVDVFTDEAFKGNAAGVCLLSIELSDSLMQNIAAELNLSETAFLLKDQEKDNIFHIRYFTPTTEIPFCGHATFGSACLLLQNYRLKSVELITSTGLHLTGRNEDNVTIMQFPVYDPVTVPVNEKLLNALGISEQIAYKFSHEISMLLIEIEDVEKLMVLAPDFTALLQSASDIQEVVVTAKSKDNQYDFYSRCFCPWIGINEDPVTGAAHCLLAPHWQRVLQKNTFKAFQCSKRGGYLNLKIESDTLLVSSTASIILEGMMNL